MSNQQIAKLSRAGALVGFMVMSGCSLWFEDTRPEAGSRRNLSCFIEYRPSATDSTKPDLLFFATAFPYRLEEVYMNPVETLFHGAFAPGRHLTAPLQVVGAACESPPWSKGHRLPHAVHPRHALMCKRIGLERVMITGETKYGQCQVEIPAGESAPVCKQWFGKLGMRIEKAMKEPCRASRAARSETTKRRSASRSR